MRWRIASLEDASAGDRAVDLRFHAALHHQESRRTGPLQSDFVQQIGRFSGTIRVGGEPLTLSDLWGVAEDQDILW